MKLILDVTPEMMADLEDRTEKAKKAMEDDGYDFSDWRPELEAVTILRMALEKETERDVE